MPEIVPDSFSSDEIVRQIRNLPEEDLPKQSTPRPKKTKTYVAKSVIDPRLENQYPGAVCVGMLCESGVCRIAMVMTGTATCPNCGAACTKFHGYETRRLRDCPFAGAEHVEVQIRIRRVKCTCGCRRQEAVAWIQPHKRMTVQYYALLQAELRQETSINKISVKHNLNWHAIKEVDKWQLSYYFSDVDVSRLRRLAIDEFALHKGHRYATTFMDLDTGAIIFVVQGKTLNAVRKGFEHLKNKGVLDQIEAVACDMNAGFPRLVAEYCPKADLVYDLFHVVSNFKDMVKEARLQIIRNCDTKARREMRKHLSGIEWSFVMAPEELSKSRSKRLQEVLADNELFAALQPVMPLIRSIWQADSAKDAESRLNEAANLLAEIGKKYDFEEATKFSRMLKRRKNGLIMAHKHRIGTNKLEGANNKIKVLKRVAYGYRDFEYFALKIKSAVCGDSAGTMRFLRNSEAVLPEGKIVNTTLSFSIGRIFTNRPLCSTQLRRRTWGLPKGQYRRPTTKKATSQEVAST